MVGPDEICFNSCGDSLIAFFLISNCVCGALICMYVY